MNRIKSIVTTYTTGGKGKLIYVARFDGCTRAYTYTEKRYTAIEVKACVDTWDAAFFPRSIHITRKES